MLCGAKGIVEVNKLVRSDKGLQQAFGRECCAEQSVIQQTLDASNAVNVQQIEAAMDEIYRLHGQGYQYNYTETIQVLDVGCSTKKPQLKQIGFIRLSRDIFTTTGELCFNQLGRLDKTL